MLKFDVCILFFKLYDENYLEILKKIEHFNSGLQTF